MDAVAVVMVGAGVWVMYSAYKGHDPFTTALGILKGTTVAPNIAGLSSSGNAGATGSAAVGSIVQTPTGPVKVH
jgi:hypothetical protein